jgi:DNA polymerase-3 subunit gamma/tau
LLNAIESNHLLPYYLQGLEELENNLRSYFARKINQPGYDDPTEDFAFVFELDAASNNSVILGA